MKNRYSGYSKVQKTIKKMGYAKVSITALLGYYHKDQVTTLESLEFLQLLGLVDDTGAITPEIVAVLACTRVRPLDTMKVPRGGAKKFTKFYALRARVASLKINGLPAGPAAYFLLKVFQEGVSPTMALEGMDCPTGTAGSFKDRLVSTGLVGGIPNKVWNGSWVPSPRLRKYLTSENNGYFDREGDQYGYGSIAAHKRKLTPVQVAQRDLEWAAKYKIEENKRLQAILK